MEIPEMGILDRVLEHLPLPKHGYYYDENAVANRLSLGRIADKFRVSTGTDIKDSIYVHGEDGKYLRFKWKGDLYCMNKRPLLIAEGTTGLAPLSSPLEFNVMFKFVMQLL